MSRTAALSMVLLTATLLLLGGAYLGSYFWVIEAENVLLAQEVTETHDVLIFTYTAGATEPAYPAAWMKFVFYPANGRSVISIATEFLAGVVKSFVGRAPAEALAGAVV